MPGHIAPAPLCGCLAGPAHCRNSPSLPAPVRLSEFRDRAARLPPDCRSAVPTAPGYGVAECPSMAGNSLHIEMQEGVGIGMQTDLGVGRARRFLGVSGLV